MRTMIQLGLLAALLAAVACSSKSAILQAKDGGRDSSTGGATGGMTGTGGQDAAGRGGTGGGGGAVGIDSGMAVDLGMADSALTNCTGLVCGADQQGLKVSSPALGTTQCACVPLPSAGICMDCGCGSSLCAQYFARCLGFALEGGLLCGQNG